MDPVAKIRIKDVGHFALHNWLYPQYVPRVPEMNPGPKSLKYGPHLLQGEHSFLGAPASLYNLAKSAPDTLVLLPLIQDIALLVTFVNWLLERLTSSCGVSWMSIASFAQKRAGKATRSCIKKIEVNRFRWWFSFHSSPFAADSPRSNLFHQFGFPNPRAWHVILHSLYGRLVHGPKVISCDFSDSPWQGLGVPHETTWAHFYPPSILRYETLQAH